MIDSVIGELVDFGTGGSFCDVLTSVGPGGVEGREADV